MLDRLIKEFWMIPMPPVNYMAALWIIIPLAIGLLIQFLYNRAAGKTPWFSFKTNTELDEEVQKLHLQVAKVKQLHRDAGKGNKTFFRMKHGDKLADVIKSC